MSLFLDGRVLLYGSPHWFRGQQDIFEVGCFHGSLDMVWMGIDHRYHEAPLGRQEDGTLALHDDGIALSFRLTIGPGVLERLDGRDEASAAYVVRESETRNGIRYIRSAILMEISACHVATVRESHCLLRDAATCGTLAADSKNRFASDAAGIKFVNALKKLDD